MADNGAFHFPPHVVAGMLDLSPQTVRRWAEYHKEHLSESANPKPGIQRGFTYTDIETLRKIKVLRSEGLSGIAVNSRLSGEIKNAINSLPTDVSLLDSTLDSTNVPDSTKASDDLDLILTLATTCQNIQQRLTTLEAVREQDRRDRLDQFTMICIGICIGLLFAVGMIVLAWLYGG